jgi:VWFA-related protein
LAFLLWSACWGPAPAAAQSGKADKGGTEISFVATGTGADALSAADLKLSVDGKDQTVTAVRKAGGNDAGASKLPAHTFANRGGGSAQAVSVIFLDAVNSQWRDDSSARQETIRALEQIKPDDKVAIFVFGKSLQVLSDFTDDAAARAAKLKTFGAGESGGITYHDLVMPIPQSGSSRAGMYEEQQKMTTAFAALQGVAGSLRGVSGRKNLLWVSADFPLLLGQADLGGRGSNDSKGKQSDADVERSLQASYNKAADDLIHSFQAAGLAVYPVDARPVSLTPNETKSRVTYVIAAADAAEAERNRVTINDNMKYVANETGGAVFSDSKSLAQVLRGALDDGESAYLATFAPSKLSENGSLHKLKLQTKQKGPQIRTVPGYYAPAAAVANQQPSQRLAAALSSPLNIGEVGMMVRVETDPADPAGLVIALQIDPHDLELAQQGDNWIGQMGYGSFQGSPSGEQFGKQAQSVAVSVSKKDYEKGLAEGGGLHFDIKIKRAPGASFLRFAVIDLKTPKAGSLLALLP